MGVGCTGSWNMWTPLAPPPPSGIGPTCTSARMRPVRSRNSVRRSSFVPMSSTRFVTRSFSHATASAPTAVTSRQPESSTKALPSSRARTPSDTDIVLPA